MAYTWLGADAFPPARRAAARPPQAEKMVAVQKLQESRDLVESLQAQLAATQVGHASPGSAVRGLP